MLYEYDGLDRLLRTVREMTASGIGGGAVVDTIETTQLWDDSSRLTHQKFGDVYTRV